MLALNVLSFTSYHIITFGSGASPGIIIAATLLIFFVVDYLSFEEVHLYTYDFVAERSGFKLGWGCLAFYPYFYAIPLWSTVNFTNTGLQPWLQVLFISLFFAGWILARGANIQKYYFKRDPGRSFLGIIPETISDDRRTLLVNGFWGLSRHMATGIVLCTGQFSTLWPWLYPLYYIVFLTTRQIDDDKRCMEKYGTLWEEYIKKVKYRIIPFIY